MALESLSTLGRNEPCHCGSGKKYKHCHMREDLRLAAQGKPTTEDEEYVAPSKAIPVAIGVSGAVVAVGAGVQYGAEAGFLFAVIGALLLGGYFIFRNPPPPRSNGGDPSGLNFGR